VILSIQRSRRWPRYAIGAAVLAVVAYVFHEAGAEGVEPAPPKVGSVTMPIVAPPGPNAEPERVAMNEPVSAPVLAQPASSAPERVVLIEPPPEQAVPTPTAHVTALIKQGQACAAARAGLTADQVIARIVERDGTISTEQMERMRAFEARCLSE
jgi:hypothetical protein